MDRDVVLAGADHGPLVCLGAGDGRPGPGTAIKIGFLVGFAAGFPMSFAQAAWSPIPRIFPLGWMLEMWVGAILATLVGGALYRE